MQNETKTIKIWVGSNAVEREKALNMNWAGKNMKMSMTMKAEYNRKIMVCIILCRRNLVLEDGNKLRNHIDQ